jgi:hypothetical protein
LRAVIHVVGNADGMNAGKPERLAADCPIGEKSFGEGGAIRRRQVEAAFQIAEHHVRRAQVTGDFPKRHLRIGDIHEIDVARQNQRARHTPSPLTSNLRALATYLSRRTYPAASHSGRWGIRGPVKKHELLCPGCSGERGFLLFAIEHCAPRRFRAQSDRLTFHPSLSDISRSGSL